LKITIKDWDHTCGDGCCYTWGVDVTLEDGRSVSIQNVGSNEARYVLEEILPLFNIKTEIECE
jgi:hypothetical protein